MRFFTSTRKGDARRKGVQVARQRIRAKLQARAFGPEKNVAGKYVRYREGLSNEVGAIS
jgi:hypothetical protein